MNEEFLWENEHGAFLRVRVKPKSGKRSFVQSCSDDELVLNLKEPAKDGKANKELMKKLSKELGISSSEITLVGGHKSKEKTLLFPHMSKVDLRRRLSILHKR